MNICIKCKTDLENSHLLDVDAPIPVCWNCFIDVVKQTQITDLVAPKLADIFGYKIITK